MLSKPYAMILIMLKRTLKTCIIIMILATVTLSAALFYRHQQRFPSTEDAYLQAHLVNVSPQINGKIIKVFVIDHQAVKQGTALFSIDPTPMLITLHQAQAKYNSTLQLVKAEIAAVDAAKAQLAQRHAEWMNAKQSSDRILSLVKQKLYPLQAKDQAIRNLKVARAAYLAAKSQLKQAKENLGIRGPKNAKLQAAKAAIAQAKLNLSYTTVRSPVNGHIAKFSLRKGMDVIAYQPLFTIVDESYWWVMANFKETKLQRIQPGQTANISIDLYPGKTYHGTVQSISPGSGASFSLLPPEEASGNWVKVIQRFPVKISLHHSNDSKPLRIGASCTVTIDTQSAEQPKS